MCVGGGVQLLHVKQLMGRLIYHLGGWIFSHSKFQVVWWSDVKKTGDDVDQTVDDVEGTNSHTCGL